MRAIGTAQTEVDRPCPLGCGSLRTDGTILRDNRFSLPHTVRIGWCDACGLGVTLDPPSRGELDELYARTYAEESTVGRVPRTGTAARLWHRVNGSLPLTDRHLVPPVLDVGANTGETLLALRERGLEATGVEPNPRAAEIAAGYGLDIIAAPIETAPLPQEHFGTVLLSQVLEHVDDPVAVLEIVHGAMQSRATAYAIVPNARSAWRSVFGSHWVHWHVPFHLFHYTASALHLLFGQTGFKILRIRNVTPGEWLLMSMRAARNARRDVWQIEHFEGQYGRRLLIAPLTRLVDAVGRGDAIVVEAERL